jgi:hypothetical protein
VSYFRFGLFQALLDEAKTKVRLPGQKPSRPVRHPAGTQSSLTGELIGTSMAAPHSDWWSDRYIGLMSLKSLIGDRIGGAVYGDIPLYARS